MHKDPVDEEFDNADINFYIILTELKNDIKRILNDIQNIKDPEILAYAKKLYFQKRLIFFKLQKDDLELNKLYEDNIKEQNEKLNNAEDGFVPWTE